MFSWYPFAAHGSVLRLHKSGRGVCAWRARADAEDLSAAFADGSPAQEEALATFFPSISDALSFFTQEAPDAGPFAYIICSDAGGPQKAGTLPQGLARALPQIAGLLAPCGILLLSFDNAAAAREESRAGIVREQALALLRDAGFAVKIYYPLPDRHSPQLVFTDAYPPGLEILHRLDFAHDGNKRRGEERRAFCFDLVAKGSFGAGAPSFIFECVKPGAAFAPGVLIVPGLARRREHRLITVLYDDSAAKSPACGEAREALHALARNLDTLAERGLKTLPHVLKDGRMLMPRLDAPLLQELLVGKLQSDTAFCFSVLDALWEAILASSELCLPESCPLWAAHPAFDFGPVLRNAYLEMIPLNCFYINADLCFFDQEFIKERWPASYVMFRALYHLRISVLPGSLFNRYKSRYHLTSLWDLYAVKERQFQAEVNRPVALD